MFYKQCQVRNMWAEPYLTPHPPSLGRIWHWVVGSKVQRTSTPVGLFIVVRKGSMPDAQSSGSGYRGSCLPLFFFHNRQNKLGFLWNLRLLHSWMAVLHYCVHIWCCSYTSRMACQRELKDDLCNIQLPGYAWMFCTVVLVFYFSFQAATNLGIAPQKYPGQKMTTAAW